MQQLTNLQITFTPAAIEQMKAEQERYKQERVEVMERLKTAREMGDLSENGAYKYAKFELGRISRQLKYLSSMLENAVPQDKPINSQVVGFGSQVTIKSDSDQHSFTMVNQFESDLTANKLSLQSPLGTALVGKSAGDQISVDTPSGTLQYTIVGVK
ncbi:MAG: transcription elongation factor GreA [Candidatus Pacebacteria bacterium CG_4_10_14_0_8_um_filter_43_12]|nr:MAG: transcription elongation factor GreA [Candidatus Pacebacteria bacterium CG10_big_fil_rev_8_21_14_0_10_44_11]PIY78907.1 MAG: transcription elongation factor GreA [Candidatus Pacebacteria bacterium CG_4_10_14_0_8_um_filter_43_12]